MWSSTFDADCTIDRINISVTGKSDNHIGTKPLPNVILPKSLGQAYSLLTLITEAFSLSNTMLFKRFSYLFRADSYIGAMHLPTIMFRIYNRIFISVQV